MAMKLLGIVHSTFGNEARTARAKPPGEQNVAAILRSQLVATELQDATTETNGTQFDIQVGKLQDVSSDGGAARSSDILLLDLDPTEQADVELLGDIIRFHFPETPVIATAAKATIQDVKVLMRLGVVDFLPQPITRADLNAALKLAGQHQQEALATEFNGGRVIAFIKGGGGVGATTLAVQSGCALSARYKSDAGRVCLLDFDFQFGTAALYLDLQGRVDYQDLVEAPERLDAALLRGVMSHHDSGLELLAAPNEVMPLETLTPDFVTACLNIAREEYEYVIIDLPEAWTTWSYQVLHESDVIILVTQLTVAGVRQARRQLDTLRNQGIADDRVKLALNRFEAGLGKTVRRKQAEKAFGRTIDHFIVNDYKTASESINQGVAFSRVKRWTKLEKSVRLMIDEVVEAKTAGNAK